VATAPARAAAWPSAPAPNRPASTRPAYFGADVVDTPILGRGDVPEAALPGPAIVEEYDATTLVPPGWTVRRDSLGNLVLVDAR